MGGSQVLFNTPSAFTKKRKRMVGTNAKHKVEIKQWNPRQLGEPDTYNAVNLNNIFNLASRDANILGGSWLPFQVYMPTQGTGSYQRIGNTIFLKYLRFKGYMRVYQRNPLGIRWRLRLLRCDNFVFEEYTDANAALRNYKKYLGLFFNNVVPAAHDNPSNVLDAGRHNFYKLVKKVWDNNIIKTKVIASGYIPPNNKQAVTYITGTAGQGPLAASAKENIFVDVNGFYNVPIDINVKCNDVLKDGDVYYYYALETDVAVGCSFYSESAGYTYSLQPSMPNFELNFFIRGYFTDL